MQLRETDGTITRFRADGKLDYIQEPNGNRITAGYNGAGQLASLTHSNGQALTIAYNGNGRVSTVTDPASRVATYAYDASGEHLVSVTTVDGTVQYAYVAGQGDAREHALAAVTSPAGVQIHFTYDAQGRLTGSFFGTSASPINPVTIGYVSPGGVSFTDAAGTTTVLYNHVGQPAVVIDPLGRTVRAIYAGNHNLPGIALPGGLTYLYAYLCPAKFWSQLLPN